MNTIKKQNFLKRALLSVITLGMVTVLSSPSLGENLSPSERVQALNPISISNRAQCALDSEKPATSVFIMIDGFNAGKLGNSVAKIRNLKPEEQSEKAMREFRLSVSYMTMTILNKIIHGRLPLLPTNLKTSYLQKYNEASYKCEHSKTNCPELNQYLSDLWETSQRGQDFNRIDNFTNQNFHSFNYADTVTCSYIKKFSSLQENLKTTEVDQKNLQSIALAYLHQGQYLTDCFDLNPSLNNRYVTLQLDLNPSDLVGFNVQGFDVWNSVKIYLSWAWRHTQDMERMSPSFGKLFKKIALEESILFTPNGCQSMIQPTCNNEYLSINSIRELAKIPETNPKREHFENVPAGTDAELLAKGVRAVNNDFLGTKNYDSAQAWLANFRKGLIQARALSKTKYQMAMNHLNIIQDQLRPKVIADFIRIELDMNVRSPDLLNELYYLCTELSLTSDDKLDFLRTDIERLTQLKTLNQINYSERRSLPVHIEFFKSMAENIAPICQKLEAQKSWNQESYTVDKNGFSDWAKEMMQFKPEDISSPNTFKPSTFSSVPLLKWKSSAVANEVICYSAIDCARLVMKSVVDLYAVATYADALLPLSGKIQDPNIFNPYSELVSCKIYDPWYLTKKMNKELINDLANTAIVGWNFIPLYLDADYSAPKVTSFKKLIEDGDLKFDPRLEEAEVKNTLLADFGPLFGAPCAISMNNNALKNYNLFAFTGLTVNYCALDSDRESNSNGAKDIQSSPDKDSALCAACTLNFMTVGSAVGSAVSSAAMMGLNPAKFAVYTVKSIKKYIDAQEDKVNIPRSWTVNPAYAAEVYKKYGQIPEECVEELSGGLQCFSDVDLDSIKTKSPSTPLMKVKK